MERPLHPDESVNMFLADMKKLAGLFGGISEQGLTCGFIAGLPAHVKQLLCASSRMEDMNTNQLLDLAQAIMKDQIATEEMVAATISPGGADKHPNVKRRESMRCYQCSGWNQLARDCPVQREDGRQPRGSRTTIRCFWCQEVGHIS